MHSYFCATLASKSLTWNINQGSAFFRLFRLSGFLDLILTILEILYTTSKTAFAFISLGNVIAFWIKIFCQSVALAYISFPNFLHDKTIEFSYEDRELLERDFTSKLSRNRLVWVIFIHFFFFFLYNIYLTRFTQGILLLTSMGMIWGKDFTFIRPIPIKFCPY